MQNSLLYARSLCIGVRKYVDGDFNWTMYRYFMALCINYLEVCVLLLLNMLILIHTDFYFCLFFFRAFSAKVINKFSLFFSTQTIQIGRNNNMDLGIDDKFAVVVCISSVSRNGQHAEGKLKTIP